MVNKNIKILICGLGSIGQRHALNLLKIGYKNIIFLREKGTNKLNKKLITFKVFKKISEALKDEPKIALVCNTTDLHLNTARKLANNKIHFFIEKPVGFNKKNLLDLIKVCKKNRIITMVGYMMRFHPAIKIIQNILNKKKNGPFFYFRSEWGEYLPNWHPGENYKKSYASQKKMGGDISLTLSHDLDLAKYFFGEILRIVKLTQKNKLLGISSDSIIDYFVYFKKEVNGNIHLDYLQKNNSRSWKISGLNSEINFDYYNNKLIFKKNNKVKIYSFKNFNRNNLFLDEIKFFMSHVRKNKKISCNIQESYKLLNDFNLLI
jgi:predicted dehydrogenase